MPPLKTLDITPIVIRKLFQRGFFIRITLIAKSFTLVPSIPSFMYSLFYGLLRSLYNKYVFYSNCN